MPLVTKESLDDIEWEMKKRESLDLIKGDLVIKNYETLRNDISSRLTMLEAYHAIDRLIEESKTKIHNFTLEKIDNSSRIKDF